MRMTLRLRLGSVAEPCPQVAGLNDVDSRLRGNDTFIRIFYANNLRS
jgi:hypothetical protein